MASGGLGAAAPRGFFLGRTPPLAAGFFTAHFMMGAVFLIVYAVLWSLGVGAATWLWGLIFGAAHAVVAVVMMPLMMRMHPRPPEMAGGPMTVLGQLMGHMVYGLVGSLVYAAF